MVLIGVNFAPWIAKALVVISKPILCEPVTTVEGMF